MGHLRKPPRSFGPVWVILDPNGVAMARHGLILSKNGATSLPKVSKYLPCLRDTIFFQKIAKLIPGPKIWKIGKLENRTLLFSL